MRDGKEVVITGNKEKADVLNNQYSSVWSHPDIDCKVSDSRKFFFSCHDCEKEVNHCCKDDRTYDMIENNCISYSQSLRPSLTDINFCPNHIEELIANIKSSSATGPDGISAKLMKGGKSHIANMLAIIG